MNYYSSGGDGAINWNNGADLDMAIAEFYHSKAIPFNIGESDIFRKVIALARTVGPNYCTPNRNMIGGALLDFNPKSYQTKNTKDVIAEADVFGIVFLRDLATIKGRSLINIISSSFNVPVTVLGVKDFSKRLAQGGNNYATFISESFKPYLEENDENKRRTDLVFFDGALNIQKAGKILAASYSRITVLHGAAQILSLFFSDIA